MQIYEYISCYFVGFALSLLLLYISGVKKKAAFYFYAVNSVAGFISSVAFVALEQADPVFLLSGGLFGITGQGALCVLRLIANMLQL